MAETIHIDEHDDTAREPETQESTQLDNEVVDGIEALDAPVDERVEYLLAALGEKHVTIQTVRLPKELSVPIGQTPPSIPEEVIEDYLDIAKATGLTVIGDGERENRLRGERVGRRMNLFIGSSGEAVRRAFDAYQRDDALALGMELGFPETAVEAFVSGREAVCHAWEVPDISVEQRAFTTFLPSRKHYRDELAIVDRWARTVRDVSPLLYRERLEQFEVE